MTNVSTFAYLADGRNGMRIVRLIEPQDSPGVLGYAPPMAPKLIATFPTGKPAVAMACGMIKDRTVDESGNQISAFGRLGSRAFNRADMDHFLKTSSGAVFHVKDFGELGADAGRR